MVEPSPSSRLTNVQQCGTLFYVRKKLTAIRLKPEQVKQLEKMSAREDVPVSWLIRKAIDEFLKRQKYNGTPRCYEHRDDPDQCNLTRRLLWLYASYHSRYSPQRPEPRGSIPCLHFIAAVRLRTHQHALVWAVLQSLEGIGSTGDRSVARNAPHRVFERVSREAGI